MQFVHLRLHTNYFLWTWRFLKKLTDDQCSSITKGSIYHIKHRSIQPFSMGVDWPEIVHLMEVSIMFNICTYCIFTWYMCQTLKMMAPVVSFFHHHTYHTYLPYLHMCKQNRIDNIGYKINVTSLDQLPRSISPPSQNQERNPVNVIDEHMIKYTLKVCTGAFFQVQFILSSILLYYHSSWRMCRTWMFLNKSFYHIYIYIPANLHKFNV